MKNKVLKDSKTGSICEGNVQATSDWSRERKLETIGGSGAGRDTGEGSDWQTGKVSDKCLT